MKGEMKLMKKHVVTVLKPSPLAVAGRGCGECQSSCQSACKTSCTVGNQACQQQKQDN